MSAKQHFEIVLAADGYDDDPQETIEWLEALGGVIDNVGPERAHYLIEQQIAYARLRGQSLPHAHFCLGA